MTDARDGAQLKMITSALVGRRIVGTRYLTAAECGEQYWQHSPLVLLLDDGTTLVPMSDEEGNDAGALGIVDGKGHALCVPVQVANAATGKRAGVVTGK